MCKNHYFCCMHRIFFLFILSCSFLGQVSAQHVAVGQWRDHLPYSTVIDVATTSSLIYAATPYSLYYYDEPRWVFEKFSTVNGLNDIGIAAIEYSNTYKMLIIGYTNTNIDLMLADSTVYNIPDIKRKSIPGNKTINNVYIHGRYAYLSCGFGIVVLDLLKKEIKDTYYIGENGAQVNVSDIVISSDSIYASSDEGIFCADINSPNLAYFGNWEKMQVPVANGNYGMMELFNNKLFAVLQYTAFNSDTAYYYENNIWHAMPNWNGKEIISLTVSNSQLILCGLSNVQLYDASLNSLGNIFTYGTIVPSPNCAQYTPDGRFLYIGDNNYGLVKTWNLWGYQFLRPEGPFSTNTFSLSVNGSSVAFVPGGFNESWSNLYRQSEISVFHDEEWDSYYGFLTPGLDTISDLVVVQTDPADPKHVFAGSYNNGLVEIRNNAIDTVYNAYNSTLSPVNGFPDLVKVTGLTYDADGNLWINTIGNNKFLSVLKPNGQFKTFSFSSSYSFSSGSNPVIDQNGYKWIALPRAEGLFVFNDNNTLDLTSDDQYKKLSSSEGAGALPSMNVQCVAVDHDNEIWIGTDAGIAVIYNPENVFEGGSYDAEQILVDVGGFVQPLLKSEKVKCIAVDGANRKWIGTEKAGAFLLSEDGTEEIYHFTSSDSPLLADDINGIAIMPESGEVFFATALGIISFRGTATVAKESLDSVYVFPNPVKSDFHGYVSVSGLIENGWVSITDIYGTLIYKTRAQGGQAVWNCLDMNGDRPATGVYLIFVTNDDGTVTNSSKLMFYH